MTWSILSGDCLERLADLDDDLIDAVVTDPPYGLEFMGKDWDAPWRDGKAAREFNEIEEGSMGGFRQLPNHSRVNNLKCRKCKRWKFSSNPCECEKPDFPNARRAAMVEFQLWTEAWATELLRVLKPGGHLLAFGGTRTYHRLASGIEDAGFEIRDCLAWHYGSGFPKSLDVSKAIDRRRYDLDEVYTVTGWIREARDAAGIGNREIDEAFGANGMARHWTDVPPNGKQPAVPTLDQVPKLLEVLGVEPEDVPEEIRRLLYDLNGIAGEPGENWWKREVVEERTMIQGGGNALQLREGPRREVEANVTAPATDLARQWQGWGTALKPAFEPIILARKPLIGTVAENVTRYGTGALNVDGCRVGTEGGYTIHTSSAGEKRDRWEGNKVTGEKTDNGGRWPANLILDEEAAAMLDEQSGELPTQKNRSNPQADAGNSGMFGVAKQQKNGPEYLGDTGGASRFFYQAKASRAERNAGLGAAFEVKRPDHRDETAAGHFHEKGIQPQKNAHPTVKPIDLMRWLVRLVTPPGGTVLDPFTGSGTTGIAAGLEGFEFVGIEREAEYRKIAEARLRWWAEQEGETAEILQRAGLAEKERAKAEAAGQTSLFEEAA